MSWSNNGILHLNHRGLEPPPPGRAEASTEPLIDSSTSLVGPVLVTETWGLSDDMLRDHPARPAPTPSSPSLSKELWNAVVVARATHTALPFHGARHASSPLLAQ